MREHEADTIYWLLARLLSSAQQSRMVADTIGIVDPMEIVENSLVAWFLEMVGDRLMIIATNILELEKYGDDWKEDFAERLSQIGQISFTMLDKAVNSMFEGDMKVASDAVDLFEAIETEEGRLLKELQGKTDLDVTSLISAIAWDMKIIAEHSAAIAEISIDSILKVENDFCAVREMPASE